MIQRMLLAAIIATTLASYGPPLAQAAPARQSACHVWAYYMGFWTGTAGDAPLRGAYSPSDPSVVAAQIDEARSAGVEAFVVDWFGAGHWGEGSALRNVLDRAAERGFTAGAAIDSFEGRNNADRESMTASLRLLVDEIVHHPAYLRYQGKPVIFFAFQQHASISDGEWQAIRSDVDPGRSTIWVVEGTKTCRLCGTADGMYAFNMAWSDGKSWFYTRDRDVVRASGGWFYVPTVNPGWDESAIGGRPNPTGPRGRRGGQFLTDLWNGAAATGTDVRLVVSWNEFMENSHIEPSVNYGTQALDTLRGLVAGGCQALGTVGEAAGPASDHGGTAMQAPVTVDLVREAAQRQVIQFNPAAALQQQIFADGFVPNSAEFDTQADARSWRAQRAEHLGDGRVRVYYVAMDDWATVRIAQRGAAAGPLEQALLADGERAQVIQFNPAASLQQRIFRDGLVPNSSEFRWATNGTEHAAQRAEHLATGEVRVYFAPVTDYADVRSVTR